MEAGVISSSRTPKALISLLSNDVVVVELDDYVSIDVDDVIQIVNKQGELTENKKHPVVSIPSEFTSITKEARHFMSGKEAAKYTSADAFVIRSLAHKILADFYLRFQNPVVPTKVFRTKEEAIEWAAQTVKTRQ